MKLKHVELVRRVRILNWEKSYKIFVQNFSVVILAVIQNPLLLDNFKNWYDNIARLTRSTWRLSVSQTDDKFCQIILLKFTEKIRAWGDTVIDAVYYKLCALRHCNQQHFSKPLQTKPEQFHERSRIYFLLLLLLRTVSCQFRNARIIKITVDLWDPAARLNSCRAVTRKIIHA